MWGAQNAVELVVTHSAGRSYASSTYVLPMAVREADWEGLVSTKAVDFDLVTLSGTHRDFPFDSGVFDFTLGFRPPLQFGLVRIVNRVPGFVAGCSEAKADRNADSSLHIRFALRQSPLLQITALVLAVGFLVFLGFIVTLHDVKALATAAASFFFSVWSIRNVLGSEIHTFPTLLDCFVLTVCIGLVIVLSWKAALSGPNTTTSQAPAAARKRP